jgi:hypothetical protein
VQWLSDNGSIFAAHRTIEIALALNVVPCFTPVESPESNGGTGTAVRGRGEGQGGRAIRATLRIRSG